MSSMGSNATKVYNGGGKKEKISQIKIQVNKEHKLIYLLKVNLTSMLAGSET